MYDFVLPVSQKAIKWKPLDVGQQLALGAAYQGNQKIYLDAAMYAARIVQYGDKTATPGVQPCSFPEIQVWDEVDYTLFSDEVTARETERFNAFRKKEAPTTTIAKAEKAISDANSGLLEAMRLMSEAMAAIKEAGLAANAPLTAR